MKKVSFRASLSRDALDTLRAPGRRYFAVRPDDLDGPSVRAFFGEHEPPYAFAVTVEEYADDKSKEQLKYAYVCFRRFAQHLDYSENYIKQFLKSKFGQVVDLEIEGERYRWLKSLSEYTFEEFAQFLNLVTQHITESGIDIEDERQKYLVKTGRKKGLL